MTPRNTDTELKMPEEILDEIRHSQWLTSDNQLVVDMSVVSRVLSRPAPSAQVESYYRGLCEIREIYCNMEGFIPETAAEAYVLQEIKKMYDTAVEFIALQPSPSAQVDGDVAEVMGAIARLTEGKYHYGASGGGDGPSRKNDIQTLIQAAQSNMGEKK